MYWTSIQPYNKKIKKKICKNVPAVSVGVVDYDI